MDETDPALPAVDPNRRLLGGRYEIGEVLGYGGMAEVFRGRDTRLSRDVAVKVLRADLARDPSFQMRFRREAQAAASLNHSAIVAVYTPGVGELIHLGVPREDVLAQDARVHQELRLEGNVVGMPEGADAVEAQDPFDDPMLEFPDARRRPPRPARGRRRGRNSSLPAPSATTRR